MKIIILIIIFSCSVGHSKAYTKTKSKKDPTNFYLNIEKKKKPKYIFNQYENIIAGTTAFVIGNIGYLTTDSPVLKLAYTGIQTIGIMNVGSGIYQMNSMPVDAAIRDSLSLKNKYLYSKKQIANTMLKTFATNARAKRLALFYSSSILAGQYFMNATIYDSPGRLKNIYMFFLTSAFSPNLSLNKYLI